MDWQGKRRCTHRGITAPLKGWMSEERRLDPFPPHTPDFSSLESTALVAEIELQCALWYLSLMNSVSKSRVSFEK